MTAHSLDQERESAALEMTRRLRRNRKSPAIRALVQETHLHPNNLVAPLFILEGEGKQEEISSMPGVFRRSIDLTLIEVIELYALGIRAIELFPIIPKNKKDPFGSEAIRSGNLLQQSIRDIKEAVPEMCIMVDIALDPYTDHGHDGIINSKGQVLNDVTVRVLGKMSLLAAEAGADVVAPSDMMDGRVAYIRHALDEEGYRDTSILSYAAKYASALYGPYREVLKSTPIFGDKSTYQMSPSNSREALIECNMDEWEGADMLLIKPALAYLDIITKVREQTELPIGAYQVSGEYAMIKAAAQNGWVDGDRVLMESLISIKRAGAGFILTYAAKEAAKLIQIQ